MREKRVHKFEDISIETAQTGKQRWKIFFFNGGSLKILCNNIKGSNFSVVGVPEGEENECGIKRKDVQEVFHHYFFKFGEIHSLKDSSSLTKPRQNSQRNPCPGAL